MSSNARTLGILAIAGAAGLLGGAPVGVAIGVILLGVSRPREDEPKT